MFCPHTHHYAVLWVASWASLGGIRARAGESKSIIIHGIVTPCPGDTQQRKPHKEIPAGVRSSSLPFGDVKTDFSVDLYIFRTAAKDSSAHGDNVELHGQRQ